MMSAVSRRTALLAANTPVTPLKPKTMPPMDEYGHAVPLPRGGPHDLVLQQKLPSRDVTGFETAPLCQSVSSIQACSGGAYEPTDALIFSGCMEFDLGSMHPLVALMPEVMFVGTLLERYPVILPMLEAMEREARGERAGFAGILARLADVVCAFIVRAWVECGCGDASGWVAALRDPRELWRKLGDDGVRRAAYRGGCQACQNLFERAIRHEQYYQCFAPASARYD
ncbi:MAG: cupin domain-containing protein [Microvirga sp.]